MLLGLTTFCAVVLPVSAVGEDVQWHVQASEPDVFGTFLKNKADMWDDSFGTSESPQPQFTEEQILHVRRETDRAFRRVKKLETEVKRLKQQLERSRKEAEHFNQERSRLQELEKQLHNQVAATEELKTLDQQFQAFRDFKQIEVERLGKVIVDIR